MTEPKIKLSETDLDNRPRIQSENDNGKSDSPEPTKPSNWRTEPSVGVKAAIALVFLASLSLIVMALVFSFDTADASFSFNGKGIAVGAVGVSGFYLTIFMLMLWGYKSLYKLIAKTSLILVLSISIATPFIMPSFATVRASSHLGQFLNNLSGLNNTIQLYAFENDGQYPNLIESQWSDLVGSGLVQEPLVNPYTNSHRISSLDNASLNDGWAYNKVTGVIYAIIKAENQSSEFSEYPYILYLPD